MAPDPDVMVLDPLASVSLMVTTVDPASTRRTITALNPPLHGITRWTISIDCHGCKQITVARS